METTKQRKINIQKEKKTQKERKRQDSKTQKENKNKRRQQIYTKENKIKREIKRNDYARPGVKLHLSYAFLTIKEFMQHQPLHIKMNIATQIKTH